MSLQVWLPFNGSFENQGCGDYVITESTTSKVAYDDNGKIGKCKKAGTLKINKNPLGLNGTIAFWLYVDENYDRSNVTQLFGNDRQDAVAGNRKWSLFLYPDIYSIHSWGCQKDTSSNSDNGGYSVRNCLIAGQWNHVVVAHDENKQYIYTNGELKATYGWDSSGTFTFDVETTLTGNFDGESVKMNDLRLYDHCLSVAEVQELAKGLICHLPMNHSGFENYNLVDGTATWSNWDNQQSGELAEEGVWTLNSATEYPNYMSVATTSGEKFTIGIDVKADEAFTAASGIVLFQFFNSSGSRLSYFWGTGDFTTDWVRKIWTITIPSDTNIAYFCVGIRAADGKKVYFRKLKIERGEIASPWGYSVNDMKIDSLIEMDISGYGYNGTLSKLLTYTTDSAIGNMALNLKKINYESYIRVVNYPKFEKDFTWNVWVKQNNSTSPLATQMVISQGRDYVSGADCGMNLLIVSGKPELRYGNYIAATDTSEAINNNKQLLSNTILDNNWHMLTASVNKEGVGRIYIDGVLKATKNDGTICKYSQATGNLIVGKMSYQYTSTTSYFPFNGLIDDVRLYATTLTDEDILSLYQAKARINKNGTMFCNEYIENENNISTNIEKTSILNTQKVSEKLKLYDMETTVLDDGSVWARVFYHHCHGGTVLFSSVDECKNTQTEDKYSRLAFIDEFRGEDGKFEFMLRYPTDTSQYNRWKQLNNPCDEYIPTTSTGEGVAEGYEAVHIDWASNYWGGLTRQAESTTALGSCYLSGSVGHGNWFYAIGAKSTHGDGMPNATSSTANDVEVWIRIDTAFIDRKNICPTSFDDWEERRI